MMKKYTLITLIAMLLFGTGAMAQNTGQITVNQGQPADTTNGPKIKMDKDVHDYGTIEQGADGMCTFTITNTGNEPLIISLCKGSCGCTVPKCPQEPILPGDSAEITVKYNTSKVGPINRSVTITSNAVNDPRKRINIKGNVKAKPQGGAPINTGGPTN